MQQLAEFLNRFLYLKKGYSILAHVLPFGIASLLLLTLTVSSDNLLLKLVLSLKQPAVWLPAVLLSAISTVVYVLTVYAQIRKAYIFPEERNKLRTGATCFCFLLLCALTAYIVLRSASVEASTCAGAWACLLVAILSLTGIGWSTPSSWADAMGVKHPDYSEAHRLVPLLTAALVSVRNETHGSKSDVTNILIYAGNLKNELEKNADCEPAWAQQRVTNAKDALAEFVAAVTASFANADDQVVGDFADVMNCQRDFQYHRVVVAVTNLRQFWPKWGCPNPD